MAALERLEGAAPGALGALVSACSSGMFVAFLKVQKGSA
jgi:hypothetical protein